MKAIRIFSFPTLLLFAAIVIAFLLRVIFINEVPGGISSDENIYAITARSVILTGYDLTGTWSPVSALFFHYPPSQNQAELSYFLFLPSMMSNVYTFFSVRILFILMSVSIVILTYLLLKLVTNNTIGIIGAFVTAINPWLIFIGRTSYEMTPAILFYLAGMYTLLRAKKAWILLSLPFFLLAFYAYIATKLIFLPIILITCLYAYHLHKKKEKVYYLTTALLSLGFVLFFIFSLHFQSGSRLSEILLPTSPAITREVNANRKLAISSPLTTLTENKYSVYGKVLMTKFVDSLSLDYLFLRGDRFFGMWRHGLFYIVDLLFFCIGCLYLFLRNRAFFYFLILGCMISILPQVFHSYPERFTPHITLFFPFALCFIASGIYAVLKPGRNKRYQYALLSAVILIYLASAANFISMYFLQYPLQNSFDYQSRIVSRYIALANTTKSHITLYSPNTTDIFMKYLFYSHALTKESFANLITRASDGRYAIGSVSIAPCDSLAPVVKQDEIHIVDYTCGIKSIPHISLARFADSGELYQIYNDGVCKKMTAGRYLPLPKLSQIELERLSPETFCKAFMVDRL